MELAKKLSALTLRTRDFLSERQEFMQVQANPFRQDITFVVGDYVFLGGLSGSSLDTVSMNSFCGSVGNSCTDTSVVESMAST